MVNRFHLYPFLFTPAYMSQADGFAVTFLMDLKYLTVDKPEGYDAADAKETLKSYETEEKDAEEGELPNVIVIMDEAFSDPAVLGDMQTNEDYMPFIHSLQQGADHTVTGYLNVSVKGGNTANTEFEFLTGNSMNFLPSGSIPYQQYILGPTDSLDTIPMPCIRTMRPDGTGIKFIRISDFRTRILSMRLRHRPMCANMWMTRRA